MTSLLTSAEAFEVDYSIANTPSVSLIILSYNSSQQLELTLGSVLEQIYDNYEVIIVDASSRDRSLEVIRSFSSKLLRTYSVAENNVYDILNRGISLASGKYLQFLYPGDFFLSKRALATFAVHALEEDYPDLLYCGSILHGEGNDSKVLLRDFSWEELKQGHQPTSLQACWFRSGIVRELGRFSSTYQTRGGFALFCSLLRKREFSFKKIERVFLDYEGRSLSQMALTTHFFETLQLVYKNFGLYPAFNWLFIQNDLSHLFSLWFKQLKRSFLGDA